MVLPAIPFIDCRFGDAEMQTTGSVMQNLGDEISNVLDVKLEDQIKNGIGKQQYFSWKNTKDGFS